MSSKERQPSPFAMGVGLVFGRISGAEMSLFALFPVPFPLISFWKLISCMWSASGGEGQ